jgi:hypothetical protein
MSLLNALQNLTHEQAEAIRQALDQYVENGVCNDQVEDEDIYAADPHLTHAEAVLELLNGEMAALAES